MGKVLRRTLFAVIATLLLLALAAAGGWWWLNDMLQPVQVGGNAPVFVEIPPGARAGEVADLLYEQHLIKEPRVFRYYARYLQLDSQLKPGEYELSADLSPEAILRRLASGEVVVRRFAVPEGLTVVQIADLLASQGLVNRDRFLQLALESPLADEYLPADEALAQPLEGYLFPATYSYHKGVTEEEILATMFARFEQVWTPELRERAEEQGLSIHEVTTLASIIEKEAQVASERPRIGGVYYNRLQIGMKLDADPTVRYGLDKPLTEELLYRDLEVETPYNTYLNAGLPPGPIAAPGEDAIRGALYPESHDYWFFVAKADGSGEHYFSTTLAEQTANIFRAEENARQR